MTGKINWEGFKKITTQVRNYITLSVFDTALATIYAHEALNFIRIYSKTITVEELESLYDKYQEVILRLFIG